MMDKQVLQPRECAACVAKDAEIVRLRALVAASAYEEEREMLLGDIWSRAGRLLSRDRFDDIRARTP